MKTASDARVHARSRHILIEAPSPVVDGGRYAVKRIVGDVVEVEADVFRDGHSFVRVDLLWRIEGEAETHAARMKSVENDRWRGSFRLEKNALYTYTVEAWTDVFETWRDDFSKRTTTGVYPASDALEGANVLQRAGEHAAADDQRILFDAAKRLRGANGDSAKALAAVNDPAVRDAMDRHQERLDRTRLEPWIPVFADRERAVFGAWYELFIRSQSPSPKRSGTFADAEKRLPDIRAMGFDVVYLAPIHPIGKTARKGPNNALTAKAGDPGCPWAIGSEAGGHTAVEPALGTLADFERFVKAARKLDMEVALDFAIQCSPDHPWVREHPAWFYHRPDGSIKCAENPPFRYDDIYPLNFNTDDRDALWAAMRDVLMFWIDRGVTAFRIDNPHTKPFDFWEWLIGGIRKKHPEFIFLGEAFTRPKIMKALSTVGFTQSYTYFTWRNSAGEFRAYLRELTEPPLSDFLRPNFFTNTPDVLSEVLQKGGRPALRMRLALAAALSPSYGIYSGYELCENEAIPGTEEYKDSEKFEVRYRDWKREGNIIDDVVRLNRARRENPALQRFTNVQLCETDNPNLVACVKATADFSNVVIVVISMDPFGPQNGNVRIATETMGLPAGARYRVVDLMTDRSFEWAEWNFVQLDPSQQMAHVLRVER